ncbi:hypothetical protein J5226_04715 [Lysobacter sp. K5869]|uniref:hypothetical protein n=1 Tax=Lysobacter sp. K5869 TaxID=2820808 RepID=UPI001C061EDA|nr:hypothetical protein [Lysobacter sp. K5869]QWP77720.1 hypothetical protein J5226_04715 [Lysobacter sp. K5869]
MNARARPLRHAPLWLIACLLATAVVADGRAQPPLDSARIGAAGRGLDGRAAINQAAGAGNAQANQAALSLSSDGAAFAAARADQRIDSSAALAAARRAQARIDAGAFADAHGLLQLNQSAGAGNAQLNQFALARGGGGALDDAALAQVAGPATAPLETRRAPGLRDAAIADDAFRGGQGVLQLNQTAGIGNASVNAIVLRLPGSAP